MKCISRSITLLVSLGVGLSAAEGCVAVDGARIRAGDLAGAAPAFAALPPEKDLAPAPAGTLVRIAQICESAGAAPQAIYPVGRRDEGNCACDAARPVIVRFHTRDISAVIAALEAAGYPVDEAVQSESPAMAA